MNSSSISHIDIGAENYLNERERKRRSRNEWAGERTRFEEGKWNGMKESEVKKGEREKKKFCLYLASQFHLKSFTEAFVL